MTDYERVPPEEFDWPCDLRVAHGPHGDYEVIVLHPVQPDGGGYRLTIDCPGVAAHPGTMAGTVWRRVRTDDVMTPLAERNDEAPPPTAA